MLTLEQAVTIQILHQQGKSIKAITRELGVSRNTVRKYLQQNTTPQYQRIQPRISILDPYKPYLLQRVNAAHAGSFLMNLQYDRIEQLCQKLNLPAIASQWSHHAQQILGQDGSYADFVEAILTHEYAARQQRSQQVLMKLSGLP
ncbi:helix-turn-helix domain-containing protein, partial [Acinetobacter baumannii]|uniref:helix-turn-helix domain-containing protein n=2 Tax=Acinetobacter baumannii TaxID=470 RepID=UPI0038912C09